MGKLWWTVAVVGLAIAIQATCEERAEAQVVPVEQWTDEAKLWLSRSVLGEVGWRRPDEYSAVAWVYATRAKGSRHHDFLGMVKAYSAAIKSPGRRREPWLFELGFDKTRPRSWPNGPLWPGLHDEAWSEVLTWADEWQAGQHENPCPGANHFGGYVDRHRAEAARWVTIRCSAKMRNRFYTSLRLRRGKARNRQ